MVENLSNVSFRAILDHVQAHFVDFLKLPHYKQMNLAERALTELVKHPHGLSITCIFRQILCRSWWMWAFSNCCRKKLLHLIIISLLKAVKLTLLKPLMTVLFQGLICIIYIIFHRFAGLEDKCTNREKYCLRAICILLLVSFHASESHQCEIVCRFLFRLTGRLMAPLWTHSGL